MRNFAVMNTECGSVYDLYRRLFGGAPARGEEIGGGGGSRRYVRLWGADGATVVGVIGTSRVENGDFFALQGAMAADGVRVPAVLARDDEHLCYLLNDLGDTTLFDTLGKGRDAGLVGGAMEALARLQTGLRTTGTAALCRPPYGPRQVRWDLNYFKYCFLKTSEAAMDENRLEDEFDMLTRRWGHVPASLWGFMYRDCQSRNVMVGPSGELTWIDFQGGMPGPVHYDVASMLWQARAGFTDEFREEMTERYARALSTLRPVGVEEVMEAVRAIAPLRVLQTLGAYGLRGITQRKPHFLRSIEAGVCQLHRLAESGGLEGCDELKKISDRLYTQYIINK